MVENKELIWEIESIPDQDILYKRIHRIDVKNGEPIPGAFKDIRGSMSTDWNRYSTPEESLKRAKSPLDNGVIQLVVGDVRNLPGQTVVHSPNRKENNRAHTDVIGEKSKNTKVRLQFTRIYKWVIPLDGISEANPQSSRQ